ncbi:MAG: hypothetical protein K2J74_06410, partial [Muribaculaceae bacterium]|nr:hypothetical protein [Muribaculaceae bacterium]
MKNSIMFLLMTLVALCACQHHGQQADKSNVLPIDSISVSAKNYNEDTITSDTSQIDFTTLPDSVKISIWGEIYPESVIFSINYKNESYIEVERTSVK